MAAWLTRAELVQPRPARAGRRPQADRHAGRERSGRLGVSAARSRRGRRPHRAPERAGQPVARSGAGLRVAQRRGDGAQAARHGHRANRAKWAASRCATSTTCWAACQPPAGQTAPAAGLLAAAWKTGDPAGQPGKARRHRHRHWRLIQAIDQAVLNDHSGQRPSLDLLQQTHASRVGEFYSPTGCGNAFRRGGRRPGRRRGRSRRNRGYQRLSLGKPPVRAGWHRERDAVRILATGRNVSTQVGTEQPGADVRGSCDQAPADGLQCHRQGTDARFSSDRIEMLGGISLEDPESDA